ncbi:MAG: hypothetical protein V4805_08365 [Pseudomonadota bacterium]
MKTQWKVQNYLIVIGALVPLAGFFLNEGMQRSRLMFICLSGALLVGLLFGLITLLLRIGIKYFYSIPWPGDLEISNSPRNNSVAKIVIGTAVFMTYFLALLMGVALSAFVLRLLSR